VIILVAIAVRSPVLAARLVVEGGLVEWMQIVLMGGAGALAARQGWQARQAGGPATLEVAIVTSMAMVCIGEVDLDRVLFGTKVISTRFLVNPRYSLGLRALAALIIVGVPGAVGVWLLWRIRALWWAALEGLLEPWGQAAAFGVALFVLVETFERPLNRLRWQPTNFIEETLELLSGICIFCGLVARHRAGHAFRAPRDLC
jgi:hypothetical protein